MHNFDLKLQTEKGQGTSASVAQMTETHCTPTGMVYRRSRVQSPGQLVDFVFRFQGRML